MARTIVHESIGVKHSVTLRDRRRARRRQRYKIWALPSTTSASAKKAGAQAV